MKKENLQEIIELLDRMNDSGLNPLIKDEDKLWEYEAFLEEASRIWNELDDDVKEFLSGDEEDEVVTFMKREDLIDILVETRVGPMDWNDVRAMLEDGETGFRSMTNKQLEAEYLYYSEQEVTIVD